MMFRFFPIAVKFSILSFLVVALGCAVGPNDTITLEYDGPVAINYPVEGTTTTQSFQVNDQATFTLKFNDGPTNAFLGKGSAGYQIFLGINTAQLEATGTSTADALAAFNAQLAGGGSFTIQKGEESPININYYTPTSLPATTTAGLNPITVSGANLIKVITNQAGPDANVKTADDITTEATSVELDDILSHPEKNRLSSSANYGPITFVVKNVSTGDSGGGSTLPQGPTTAAVPSGGGGGSSGCTLLAQGSGTSSTAWVWLTTLCMAGTGWGITRRRKWVINP